MGHRAIQPMGYCLMDACQAHEFRYSAVFYGLVKISMCLPLIFFLAACTQNQRSELPTDSTEVEKQASSLSSVVKRPSSSQAILESLLAQAESALTAGKLTQPQHDNAYDRYRAILLLDPNNQSAETGLQAVLLAYTERFRAVLARHRLTEAKQLLGKVKRYYPNSDRIQKMQNALLEAERQRRRQWEQANPDQFEQVEFPLPVAGLQSRSAEVVDFLSQLARRLQTSHESVLILARTDAEGRWIYRQLKSAAAGYRVRGDIRLDRSPRIRLLPPLQKLQLDKD